MTAPAGAAAIAAAIVLCGLWALPVPPARAAASTNTVQAGMVVVEATLSGRGTRPAGGPPSGGKCDGGSAGDLVSDWVSGLVSDLASDRASIIAGLGVPADGNGWLAAPRTSARPQQPAAS